jgi:hypothetical protein
LAVQAEVLSDTLSKKDVPRTPASEGLSGLWTFTELAFVPGPVVGAGDDAKEALMSQTSPILPSRRMATAYLLEEVSMLHARTRPGQMMLVTGHNAPALIIDSSAVILCERFSSYK